MILFKDQTDAGRRIASHLHAQLTGLKRDDTIVLGIPRGGVLVAAPVAELLDLPLEPVTLRKLPLPQNDQIGFGAVTLGKDVILNEDILAMAQLRKEDIDAIVEETYTEVLRRDRVYREGRPFPELKGKCVIIVDDGLATGFTMLAAVRFARKRGAGTIISAVPVAHAEAYGLLQKEADTVVSLHIDHGYSFAVASFYERFPDLPDREVLAVLKASHERTTARSG